MFAVMSYWSSYALLVSFVTGLILATFIFLIQVGKEESTMLGM